MEEEVLAGIVLGVMFALPFGWFLRSAFQWRRDARRAEPPVIRPEVAPAPAAVDSRRLEMVLERLSHRLESVEERIEFTERLLDARSVAQPHTTREPAAQR